MDRLFINICSHHLSPNIAYETITLLFNFNSHAPDFKCARITIPHKLDIILINGLVHLIESLIDVFDVLDFYFRAITVKPYVKPMIFDGKHFVRFPGKIQICVKTNVLNYKFFNFFATINVENSISWIHPGSYGFNPSGI